MNIVGAKKTIDLLFRNRKRSNSIFLKKILDDLWIRGRAEMSSIQEFEFSFVEGTKNIRFNHLYFPSIKIEDGGEAKIYENRIEKICLVTDKIKKNFHIKSDFNNFKKIVSFANENHKFLAQFGLEYDLSRKPKMKVYFSVNAQSFPLKRFCKLLNFDEKKISQLCKRKKLDTVAIDFLPDGIIFLKLYLLNSKNSGLLLRISKNGDFFSKKAWVRFPSGLNISSIIRNGFLNLPVEWKSYTEKNKMKVYYLCIEGEKKSLYFR